MSQIERVLQKLFETNRIVIWYDDTGEARGEFALLALEGVEKVEIANNEFGIKYRVLRQEPERKFLLYQGDPQPPDAENWLLDVLLAHKSFRDDPISRLLNEFELGQEFAPLVTEHSEFFRAEPRKKALKSLLTGSETEHQLRLKMCAVCAGLAATTAVDLPEILFALLDEAAREGDANYRLLERSHLANWLWARVEEQWGYAAETRTPYGFALSLFKTGYAPVSGQAAPLAPTALPLLYRWKDSKDHGAAFIALSEQVAAHLNVAADVKTRELTTLAGCDLFKEVDQEVVRQLVRAISARTLSADQVAAVVADRRSSPWYAVKEWQHIYEAVASAATALDLVTAAQPLHVPTIRAGIDSYARDWYRIDQAYRLFIFHSEASGQASGFGELGAQVENAYQNGFLYRLAANWQDRVDEQQTWPPAGIPSRFDFFESQVKPMLAADLKVLVIVSDALRFEVAEELSRKIAGEDRFTTALDAALAPLPSYTQLGMAALLPHDLPLRIDAVTGGVYVGAKSATGLENRRSILSAATNGKATALAAAEFMGMNKQESRDLFNSHHAVYLFHNVIDAMGDKRDSEGRVFVAVEDALDEIVRILKKAAGANFTNFIVTADHGFLYQHRPLEGIDFAMTAIEGGNYEDRRFVLGTAIQPSDKHKHFSAEQLGLQGDYRAVFPKGLLRLKKSGSGSRYVHGGVTLQEVVVPVLKINKARSSDVGQVDVEIVSGGVGVISTNQFPVRLFQKEVVTEKMKKRTLRIGLFTTDGVPVSNVVTEEFASTDPEHARRERNVLLLLNRHADTVNNQTVELRLVDVSDKNGAERLYIPARSYALRRTFGSDFDF